MICIFEKSIRPNTEAMKKITFLAVITEADGDSFTIPIKATNEKLAFSVATDAMTNFYGQPFDGLITIMI